MAVDVAPGDPFVAGRAEPLIDEWGLTSGPSRGYDVLSDGSFIRSVLTEEGEAVLTGRDLPTELRVIWNFFDLVRARVPNQCCVSEVSLLFEAVGLSGGGGASPRTRHRLPHRNPRPKTRPHPLH